MYKSVLIHLVIHLVPFSYGANILAIVPNPSYSHQIAYKHLWIELSLRGHKVTLITTEPVNNPNLVNLTEIDMKWAYVHKADVSYMAENLLSMWNLHEKLNDVMTKISDAELSHPEVQDLIHGKHEFDVVLAEFIYPEFLAFAEIYKCPRIMICSLSGSEFFLQKMGNPSHPALNTDTGSKFIYPLSFKERVMSVLFKLYMSYFFAFKGIPKRQQLLKKYFNVSLTVDELISGTDMMFVNLHPALHGDRAFGSSTINIGGFRPMELEPLPADLKEFLDSAKSGFIYFSLGSNIKSRQLGEQTFKAIIETFRELPYKVLWKFESDHLPEKPSNVKLVKWAPQIDVLAHPNIKSFVMQGGLQSLEEGIYHEVPLVIIPFCADQDQNSKIAERRNISKTVGRTPSVKKEELKAAILEVTNNPSYKTAVKKLKELIMDNPMTGLEKAVWWTEYVIRHKGAKHLRNPAADLPMYQYYLLDVISFLVLVTVVFFCVLILGVKLLYRSLLYILTRQNRDEKEKLQ